MRNSVMLLALGVVTSACGGAGSSNVTGPSSGPSLTRGAMVVSTATGGNVPNQDGYLLVLDTTPFFGLKWNGTARLAVPTGRHTLRLRRVPQSCSVLPDTVLDVVVLLRDTVQVSFSTTCPQAQVTEPVPPHGYVRIVVVTAGATSSSARYDVWSDHSDAWGDGGGTVRLGDVGPNGTLVAALRASTSGGGDPYLYDFRLENLHANCVVPSGDLTLYRITAGDTLHVTLSVACTP